MRLLTRLVASSAILGLGEKTQDFADPKHPIIRPLYPNSADNQSLYIVSDAARLLVLQASAISFVVSFCPERGK